MKAFTIAWTSQDVIDRAAENDILIDEVDADTVIELLEDHYDCNHGITWEDLDCFINIVMEGKTI